MNEPAHSLNYKDAYANTRKLKPQASWVDINLIRSSREKAKTITTKDDLINYLPAILVRTTNKIYHN